MAKAGVWGAGFKRVGWIALVVLMCAGLPALAQAKAPKGTMASNAGQAKVLLRDPGSGAQISVEPTPAWVEPVSGEFSPSDATAAWYYALDDTQVKLDGAQVSEHLHIIRVMRQSAGVEHGAQFEVVFDPRYQQLVFHHLAIWRDGKRIDKLQSGVFKVLQRETELEHLMYDGRITASAVLEDVRAGDRIEYDYTVRGQNPVFAGKFVEVDWASSVAPIAYYRYGVLAPSGRVIHHREKPQTYELTTRVHDGWTQTVLTRHNCPQLSAEKDATAASYLPDMVQWSEFADWAEVARWADQLFAKAIEPTEQVHAQALALTAQDQDDDSRVRHVLDFVQHEIRYFGTEMGANSHLPAEPETVLRHRYGDCKDKAALLVAMLRSLHLQAEPVLVSTAYRQHLGEVLPSPLAFDHAIARVRLGEQAYWLDGTRSHQSGALAYRTVMGLGKVLVAGAQSADLSDSPSADQAIRQEGRDVLHFQDLTQAPVLDITITYHGDLAEIIRAFLDAQPLQQSQTGMLADYARAFPQITVITPLRVHDDVEHNAVTLSVQCSVPDYLRMPQRALVGDYALLTLMSALRLPGQGPREHAFNVAYAGIYRHEFDYEFSQDIFEGNVAPLHYDEHNDFYAVHLESDGNPRSYRMMADLQLLGESVEVADWNRYKDQVTKTWPHLYGVMSLPSVPRADALRLQADIRRLDDAYKSGKSDSKSNAEAIAHVSITWWRAVLAAKRLPIKLRAQAYRQLAEGENVAGQLDQAKQDFEAALAIDDKAATSHQGYGVNAIMRGDYALGEREMDKALAIDPNMDDARMGRVWALFYEQRYADARQTLLDMLKSRSAVDSGYVTLWLYLASRRLGEDGVAAAKPYVSTALHPSWPQPIVQLLLGKIDFDQAQDLAKQEARAEGGKVDAGKLCELYFYRAMRDLLDGKLDSAKQYFQQSRDTGIVEYMEYGFAQTELSAMDKQR